MAQCQQVPMEGQYDAPTKQLNEQQLCRVAEAIGRNYELLAIELGITEVELDRIMGDYSTTIQKVLGMLRLWQRKLGERATMDVLYNAISRKKGVVTVNNAILEEVISDMSRVVSLR
ncbi:uncharacterized protein LOC132713102 [Ruditapes philippinarum]|uniref:uncharacterized protein LOC132713102 n=1 Tax=Ruditapes philippinarum TaxID=129788 RepID=UPI00295BFAB8|nr:uncharacterized protein LOC132713102 [Ruditapes philippinarum]